MPYPEPLISIIIPVYNAEVNLRTCLESVVNQTYQNFEVLLINDGSSDRSGQICDEYARLDKRIRGFHKVNGGVSSARNLGLERSTGQYICFLDADDWIEPNCLEKFVSKIQPGNSLLVFNHYVDNQTKISKRWDYQDVSYRTDEFFGLFEHLNIIKIGFPFAKFFSAHTIKSNRMTFNEGIHYGEDLLFLLEYLEHVEEVTYSNEAYYHYVKSNPFSLTKTFRSFRAELTGFLAIRSKSEDLIRMFNLSPKAQCNISNHLAKIILRPLQAFYRSGSKTRFAERMEGLKEVHQTENVKYLDYTKSLHLPVTISVSVFLFKYRFFALYDSYMRILFKYHHYKMNKKLIYD